MQVLGVTLFAEAQRGFQEGFLAFFSSLSPVGLSTEESPVQCVAPSVKGHHMGRVNPCGFGLYRSNHDGL